MIFAEIHFVTIYESYIPQMYKVVAHIPHMASLVASPDLEVAVDDSSVKAMWLSTDTYMVIVRITYKMTHHIPMSFMEGGNIRFCRIIHAIYGHN